SPAQQALSTRLQVAEHKASSLISVANQLAAKQADLESLQGLYRAYLAPVRRLPPELLLTIISVGRASYSWTSPTAGAFVEAAATVCRHWRDVITGSPDLHTWIVLSKRLVKRTDAVSLQLRRSGNLPLSIFIGCHLRGTHVDRALDLLAAHSGRWARLRIARALDTLPALARRVRDAPTMLYRLALHGFQIDTEFKCAMSAVFANAARLRHVSIRYLTPGMECVPATLIDLKAQLCSSQSVLDVLGRCTNFRMLENEVCLDDLPPENPSLASPLIAPTLRTLTLGSGEQSNTALGVLDRVALPALHTLSLTCCTLKATLQGLFERSAPPLRELKLSSVSIDEDSLIRALAHVPTLRKLRLTLQQLQSDKLIRAFSGCAAGTPAEALGKSPAADALGEPPVLHSNASFSPDAHILCPSLTELEIWAPGSGRPVTSDVLADMLEFRAAEAAKEDGQRVARLRFVALHLVALISNPIPARLKPFIEQEVLLGM
ncbi:hypothetical protein HDZ31DRAFT_38650, partial [Schizophyllum fasciatum]